MQKFINTVFGFLLFVTVGSVALMCTFFYLNAISGSDIPALNFSDSYSFNEKIRFMKTKGRDVSALVLGSSMSLNNLHSKTILANLSREDDYLNTSSWGMSMEDNYGFLKFLGGMYKIDNLILASGMVDFRGKAKHIDFDFVESYLNDDPYKTFRKVIGHFKANYYFRNFIYAKKVRTAIHDYEYLMYDSYGTVNLVAENFNIDKNKWVQDELGEPADEQQYNYLDSISHYCRSNGIELIFFQSPIRQGIWTELSTTKLNMLDQHVRRVKEILEEDSHIFVDSRDRVWPDSLFADATHFNEVGAQLFTEFCFDKISASGRGQRKVNQ
jgi:hypothetical protein